MNRGKLAIIKLYIVAMGTIAKWELDGRNGRVDLTNYGACMCVCVCTRTYTHVSNLSKLLLCIYRMWCFHLGVSVLHVCNMYVCTVCMYVWIRYVKNVFWACVCGYKEKNSNNILLHPPTSNPANVSSGDYLVKLIKVEKVIWWMRENEREGLSLSVLSEGWKRRGSWNLYLADYC